MPFRPSDEANRDGSQGAEIRAQHVSSFYGRRTRERATQHDIVGVELLVIASDLVSEPGNAVGRVVQYSRREAGLLDHLVLVEQRAHPAQVERVGGRALASGHDPALAAKSAMVSNTLRGARVSRSNCSMRASMISRAGVT